MAESGRELADNNLISKVSQLADNHLTVVRNISTGLAIAGVILFARSIRLTTKFTNAKDIPSEFIKKNVKLRGKLLSITGDRLEVEHVPISLPIVASFQRKCHSQGTLFIRFAGVEMTPSGKIWLQDRLQPSQMLWFQLLNREDSVLDCFILLDRLGFFRDCLNVEILRQGLGTTVDIPGLQHDSSHYWKFYKRLLQAEVEAQKKGKGLWKQESWLSITSHRFFSTIFIQPVKRLIKLITYFWEKK
ncbi:chromosome 3 open reading frame 33 L homeolog isoform X1 [Xenopus laevis]|uniref:Chromosome 3 open reading frame 33 L homeolog isoform X1 n=1 Tax=Xenopus laevis TaxID=8355 RepID=A0A8J0V8K2_XENLA|nr:chromosome 3 open reading frame 33 L homeolog isoform X1 [Xenopus laevis]